MKKIGVLSAIASGSAAFLALATPAFATELCPTGQFSNLCNLKIEQSSTIVGTILTILLIIAVILCLFFIVWGGIRWTMSGGDKGKIDQARGTITAAIVGLIIALLAFFIVNFVLYVITGQGVGSMTIPTLY